MSTKDVQGAAELLTELLRVARTASVEVNYCDVGQSACVIYVPTVEAADTLINVIDARERKIGRSAGWVHYSRPPHYIARWVSDSLTAPGDIHCAIIEVKV